MVIAFAQNLVRHYCFHGDARLRRISRLEWFAVWLTLISWGLLLLVRPGGVPASWGPYL